MQKMGCLRFNDRKHEIVACTEYFVGCGDSGLLEKKGMKDSDAELVDPTACGPVGAPWPHTNNAS